MEIRKMLSSKSMKFVALLLSSMLIASASAVIYYSLSITSTVTTASLNDVYFVEGADNATAGTNILNGNKTVTLATLKAYPNMTMSYSDPVRVRNNNTGTSFLVRLRHVSRTGGAANFEFISFTLNTTAPSAISLNYTSNGATWTDPSESGWATVDSSTEYSIIVQTRAGATAPIDQIATIVIELDVQL
jgi:hypothetical protein